VHLGTAKWSRNCRRHCGRIKDAVTHHCGRPVAAAERAASDQGRMPSLPTCARSLGGLWDRSGSVVGMIAPDVALHEADGLRSSHLIVGEVIGSRSSGVAARLP
jgi:hypothetical protein